jgi:hypothetical protein
MSNMPGRLGRLRWVIALTIWSLAALAVTPASAQIDRGTIQGRVTDQSGGVVPDAKVEAIQLATGTVTPVSTNGEGLYTIPNLPSGDYQVVISKPGFSPVVGEGVSIRAGAQIRVDLVLQPAGVAETVSVRASALDSAAISNSTTLDEKLVEDLPVIVVGTKRDITALLENLPGYTGGGTFSPRANGAQVGDTEVFVDGGRAAQLINRGAFAEVGPAIEQVGEFSVVSNGFNAEYGGFGIWFSNVSIKSGTNTFSGSVFDHFGHDVLNAKSYFQQEKTPYKQHEGGFTFGGPIKKDKTFFFSSLGVFYSRVGQGAAVITVPTDAFKAGDFSALGVPIYDPATTRPDGNGGFTRDPFPGNIIPANRISPAARAIIPYLPTPDMAGVNNNFFDRRSPSWPSFDTYTPIVKINHNLTTNQKLMGSYTAQIRHRVLWGSPGSGLGPRPTWGSDQVNPLDWITDQLANSWKLRFNHDWVINPQVINHVTVSVDRYINRGALKTTGQGWDDTLGIQGIPADNGAFPAIQFSGGTAAPVNFGRAYDENWKDLSWNINQSLTMSRGRHTMKFGGEFGLTGINRDFTGGAAGTFQFSNFTTSLPNSPQFSSRGNAFASFLLGDVFSTSALIPDPTRLRYKRYALFAQDEWRPTSKLTLSYGLRWDYQPPFYEVDNKMSSAILDLPNPGAAGLPGALAFASQDADRYGRSFQDPWRAGFGPRLGAGYELNDKTVLRASWGIYYSGTGNPTSIQNPGYTSTPAFSSPDNFTPVFNLATETFPQSFNRPPVLDPAFSNGQSVPYTPEDANRLPRVASFNAAIARELVQGLTLDVSYIGSRSAHLPLSGNTSEINYVPAEYLSLGTLLLQPINSPAAVAAGFTEPFSGFASQRGANTVAQSLKPFPQYTSVTAGNARLMEGRARYDSFQIKADKRFSKGLSLVSFLTYMHAKTNTVTAQYPGDRTLYLDAGIAPWTYGLSWTYELPFGRSSTGLVKGLIADWNFAGSLRYSSGVPLRITVGNNLSPLGYGTKLADRVPNVDVYKDKDFKNPATDRYLNSAAFSTPAAFAFGNTGGPLDYVRGFAQKSESFSFRKRLPLSGQQSVDLGIDIVNPFDFVRWNNPNTSLSSGAAFGSVTGSAPGRTAQVNLAYQF